MPDTTAAAAGPFGTTREGGPPRHVGMDLLRVLATYMVMQIHTGEFYYISPAGTVISSADAHWVGWLNSLFRACVPLFVMISGFYLFPIRDERQFFRKRFSRVLVPFVLWCAVYAFDAYRRGETTLTGALVDILKIPVNYGTDVGHLWFVYMLLGIYLFAPVLSPWTQTAGKRSMELFLLLCAIASTIPYLHLIFPKIWGEAFWNANPTLYYFTGYIGYIIAAVYLKRFHGARSTNATILAIVLIVAGYAVTAGGFLHRLSTEHFVRTLELTWGFTTLNVAVMTVGLFLLLKNFQPTSPGSVPWRAVHNIARRSYGMYLAHILVLNVVFHLAARHFSTAALAVPVIAVTTFALTYLAVELISFVPGSKWLIG